MQLKQCHPTVKTGFICVNSLVVSNWLSKVCKVYNRKTKGCFVATVCCELNIAEDLGHEAASLLACIERKG